MSKKCQKVLFSIVPEAEDVVQVPEIQTGFSGCFLKYCFLPMGQIDVSTGWGILPAHCTPAQLEIVLVIESKIVSGECYMEQL